jgi:hypothetical protein
MANDVTPTERQAFDRLLTLANIDCRSNPGRVVHGYARALTSDLGGDANLSTAQQMLVQRCSLLAALCTHTEATLLLGRAVNMRDYIDMASTLRRLLTTLSPNLRRVPKNITPSVAEYLSHKAKQVEGEL